jgi:hypothetical protein
MDDRPIRVIDIELLKDLMDTNDWTVSAILYVEAALQHYEYCKFKYSGEL